MVEIYVPLSDKKNILFEIGTNMLRIATDFISSVQKSKDVDGLQDNYQVLINAIDQCVASLCSIKRYP